jgi:TRAP-type C4-dicarboxylate transport system permease small subunit
VIRGLTWLARYAVWIGGAGIIFSAFLVTVEVIVRKFFALSLGGADEISGYLFAISTIWAMPFALLRRANVRIDALYALLPRMIRVFLDFLGLGLLTVFVGVVFWHSGALFIDSMENWTRSITPMQTPQAIPQAFWIVGLGLFLVTAVALFLVALMALLRRDLPAVNRLIGARSHQEEAKAEMSALDIDRPDGPDAPTGGSR